MVARQSSHKGNLKAGRRLRNEKKCCKANSRRCFPDARHDDDDDDDDDVTT
jgi:hypothetical protein